MRSPSVPPQSFGPATFADPPDLPAIVTRQEALAAGLTRDQIRQRVRGGRWRRLAAGTYGTSPAAVPPDPWDAARAAHLDRARAVLLAHPDCVLGYASAALAHDLPLVSGTPALVQVLVPEGARAGIRSGVRFRQSHLHREDIVERDGVRTTTPQRTWIDIARTHRLADALSTGDRAVARGLLIVEDTHFAIRQLGSIRGVRLATAALAHLDGRRESPLESWSHASFVRWSLPLPVPQVALYDADGLIGRVDFDWPEAAVVGEADGRLKYDEPGSLYAEKRREDRLRATGRTVIRWGWDDLANTPEELHRRLADALRRSPTTQGGVGFGRRE